MDLLALADFTLVARHGGFGLGSEIIPGEPVEGIKVKTRDFR